MLKVIGASFVDLSVVQTLLLLLSMNFSKLSFENRYFCLQLLYFLLLIPWLHRESWTACGMHYRECGCVV